MNGLQFFKLRAPPQAKETHTGMPKMAHSPKEVGIDP